MLDRRLPTPVLIGLMLLLDGLYFVWARLLRESLQPMNAAAWYFAFAAIEVAAIAAWRKELRWSTFVDNWKFFIAIGVLVTAGTILNYVAIGYIDPGTGAVLNQAIVVYNLLLGAIWLKDRLNRWQIAGAVLCVIGVLVITFQPGDFFRIGAAIVLFTAFLYAIHAALTKRFAGGIPFLQFFSWRVITIAVMSAAVVTASGQLQLPQGSVWLLLIAAATTDVVIGRALYYVALRRLSISLHTLVLTLGTVMAAVWSYILFGIQPGIQQALGALLVLAGVAIVMLRRSRV